MLVKYKIQSLLKGVSELKCLLMENLKRKF
uniref:Uncharacterized protein n=1 Tax=Rhizophora mucronata TaxID=61149 RepID=A0A2P2N643_RHIMU